MHAAHPALTRTLVNVTMKKLIVGDIVGQLCCAHSCSYLSNAFENQKQWGRIKRNTADASQANVTQTGTPTTSVSAEPLVVLWSKGR